MTQKIIDHIYEGTISFIDLPKDLKRNRQIVTAAIIYDPHNIEYVNTTFLDDYNFMLKILSHHGYLITYIQSTDLFEDFNIVMTAVTNDGMILEIIYNYEIKYKNIYETENDGCYYHKVFIEKQIICDKKKNFINNFEIVYAAVNQNGLSLEFASDEMKNNIDIVCTAINNNGLSLEFASDELKNNINIVCIAVNQNYYSILHASFNVRNIIENIIKNAKNKNLKYLYNKIKNGTLYPCAQIWIQYLTQKKIKELINWIHSNMNDHKNSFDILFNYYKKIGFYDPIRSNILSFLDISIELQNKRNLIVYDILKIV